MSNRTSQNKPNTFGTGIGRNSRTIWAGDKTVPNPEQQLTGFHIGQVMDDHDPLFMGRVWVYIAGISVTRFDNEAIPIGPNPSDAGQAYDQNVRKGWMIVSPVTPFFGSDDFRSESSPDGRNSMDGNVNAYGSFYQPRVGDFVAVMFASSDPNNGYWFGMVPRPFSNGMVPGIPGEEISLVSHEVGRSEVLEQASPTASVPIMARVPTPDNPNRQDAGISSDLAQNMIENGLSGDPVRGAGSSGSRRESPSYVTGTKSAGWSYSSERNNFNNMSGQTFGDDIQRYHTVNTSGHNLVMDDHPDSQTVRLRTSNGSQITMNDTTGIIYISNASGSSYIEMNDAGDIHIFAEGDINYHCSGDFNLSVDGNYNSDIKGNKIERIGNDSSTEVGADGMSSYGGSLTQSIGNGYNNTVGDDTHFATGNDYHVSIGGNTYQSINGNLNTTVTGSMISQSTNIDIKTSGNIVTESSGNISNKSEGNIISSADGNISVKSSGNVDIDGSNVNINSGNASDAPSASDSEGADAPMQPVMPELNLVPASPTASQAAGNQGPTEYSTSVASVVPTRQPWSGKTGFFETGSTNGYVTSCPTNYGSNPPKPYGRLNKSCNLSSLLSNIRSGALFSVSTKALDSVSSDGSFDAIMKGLTFSSDIKMEMPKYQAIRVPNVFESFTPDQLDISKNGLKSISNFNGYNRRPVLDAMGKGYIVGFGHKITAGNNLISDFISTDNFKKYFSLSNDSMKLINVSKLEALDLLSTEVNEVADWISSTFANVQMTQMQFDAMISFVHNIGLDNIKIDIQGKAWINSILGGNFGKAQEIMLDFAYLNGILDCSLLNRRRYEASKMAQAPDWRGNQSSVSGSTNVDSSTGEVIPTVNINKFDIRQDVMQAICEAQSLAPDLPKGYLFAICAQESGFKPNAYAHPHSSAAGLFQFIKDTGAVYGLSTDRGPNSNVWDPILNANAAARFNDNNRKIMVSKGFTVTSTELYFAHFLGAGGATKFLTNRSNNPNGIAATDFPSQAKANKPVFYQSSNLSRPRTYQQVYEFFRKKIEGVRAAFLDICDNPPSPSPTPSGSVQWVRGLISPNFTGVNPNLVSLIEKSAMEAGISQIPFNSGYRSQGQQNEIKARNSGAARQSQHTLGRAIDVGTHSMSVAQISSFVEALARNGATGIGIYGAQGRRFIHVDIRTSGKSTWGDGRGSYTAILRRYGFVR